jgi:DNA-binding NarL/FixJ family response regulator
VAVTLEPSRCVDQKTRFRGVHFIELLAVTTVAPIPGGIPSTESLWPGRPQPQITPLAPREQEIVDLISRGCPDKAIAVELGISVRTVRTHLERLYRKRCLHSRAEAVALWIRAGM